MTCLGVPYTPYPSASLCSAYAGLTALSQSCRSARKASFVKVPSRTPDFSAMVAKTASTSLLRASPSAAFMYVSWCSKHASTYFSSASRPFRDSTSDAPHCAVKAWGWNARLVRQISKPYLRRADGVPGDRAFSRSRPDHGVGASPIFEALLRNNSAAPPSLCACSS